MEDWLDPCLDADEMRAIDRWAIDERGVPSLDLMEAAGTALGEAAAEASTGGPARVVCGKGNNGGDGLVAARTLAKTGFEVDALLLATAEELSDDARANLDRFDSARTVAPDEVGPALAGSGVVVDAILGTGFAGAPRDPAGAIEAINGSGAPVIAADVASGVNASSGEVEGAAVRATATVTFHAPKLGHWIAPGKSHTGHLTVAPIGIPSDGAPREAAAGLISPRVLSSTPRRGPASTKFSSGEVVVVGGARGLTGAVCMSAMAAIRTGAGYATVAVPDELEHIFEIKLTEVMSVACPSKDGALRPAASDRVLSACERAAAVVFGPGLRREQDQVRLARLVTPKVEAPLVVDADGLNVHAGDLDLLAERAAPTVLTPHAGELARLLETSSDEVSAKRLESARRAAEASGATVVLKGDDTIVTDGDRVAVNSIGSPALATAGTGDVLSGMVAALIARGLEPFAAACGAVVAHARAGREAGERVGTDLVIATDVIDSIPAGLAPSGGGSSLLAPGPP